MKLKTLKTTAAALVLSGATATASAASFESYWLDIDGPGGPDTPFQVLNFINIDTQIYIENTYINATDFTFEEWGIAQGLQRDGIVDAAWTASAAINGLGGNFAVTGVGSLISGAVGTGTLNLTTNAGTIATFDVDPAFAAEISGTGLPNGIAELTAIATSFTPGYFFTDNGGMVGDDFSTLDLTLLPVFGFATTNFSLFDNATARQNAFDAIDAVHGMGGTPLVLEDPNDPNSRLISFTTSGDGQFRLSSVPEPMTSALMGLGLVGMGMLRRRKQN